MRPGLKTTRRCAGEQNFAYGNVTYFKFASGCVFNRTWPVEWSHPVFLVVSLTDANINGECKWIVQSLDHVNRWQKNILILTVGISSFLISSIALCIFNLALFSVSSTVIKTWSSSLRCSQFGLPRFMSSWNDAVTVAVATKSSWIQIADCYQYELVGLPVVWEVITRRLWFSFNSLFVVRLLPIVAWCTTTVVHLRRTPWRQQPDLRTKTEHCAVKLGVFIFACDTSPNRQLRAVVIKNGFNERFRVRAYRHYLWRPRNSAWNNVWARTMRSINSSSPRSIVFRAISAIKTNSPKLPSMPLHIVRKRSAVLPATKTYSLLGATRQAKQKTSLARWKKPTSKLAGERARVVHPNHCLASALSAGDETDARKTTVSESGSQQNFALRFRTFQIGKGANFVKFGSNDANELEVEHRHYTARPWSFGVWEPKIGSEAKSILPKFLLKLVQTL